MKPLYQTDLGKAYCGDSLKLLPTIPDASVDLVLTSPPYALHFKKEYGNADQKEYVEWFLPFAREIKRGIKKTTRRSGHNIKTTFPADKGGWIPQNLITWGKNESTSRYIKESKRNGQKVHPARFPAELPRFFIKFLTEPGELVLDP